jgi:hypothetical protein
MKLALLRRTHRDFDLVTLRTYGDLFAGGAQFKRNVAQYLPQHDVEKEAQWKRRCAAAHYVNYVAPIAQYFAAWLFTCPLTAAPRDGEAADPFYAEFAEDCDGNGTDLDDFLRARFEEALVKRRAYWRVDFPEVDVPAGATRAEFDAAGAGRAVLTPVPTENVVHWKRDARGAFEWVVEHARVEELREFVDAAPTVTETWTLWRADGEHRRWRIEHAADRPPGAEDAVPEVDPPSARVPGIPLVELALPTSLWLLNHLADAQLELFRKRNALSWAMDRTCYAMPVLFSKEKKPLATMGAGYYLRLEPEARLEWPAPPATPFETIGNYVATLKDEIHRVGHQMARGVDNNAAAIGRSGESKDNDDAATEVVLGAFGACVREPVGRTYALVAGARGEDTAWHVTGMDTYDVVDAASLADTAAASQMLKVPSPTFQREMFKKIVRAMLPHLGDEALAKVDAEIDAGVHDAALAPTPPPTQGAARDDDAEDETDDAGDDRTPGPRPAAPPPPPRR